MSLSSAEPGWWYESWSTGDWLQTLFNQPVEVHTFVLGVLVGVILATVTVNRRPELGFALALAVILFTFGAFEPVYTCTGDYAACQHVQVKPWYFLGGSQIAILGGLGMRRAIQNRSAVSPTGFRTARVFAGMVTLVLVGLAVHSFVSPQFIHPITGLSTLGGLIGAVLGWVALGLINVPAKQSSGLASVLHQLGRQHRRRTIFVLAYGATLGFGYPRLFWELGRMRGVDGFLLGPIVQPWSGVLSVIAFVSLILTVNLVFFSKQQRGPGNTSGHRIRYFLASLFAHACYGTCLFVATGFAELIWYQAIPMSLLC